MLRMLRASGRAITRTVALLMVVATVAYAVDDAVPPITMDTGVPACPTCANAPSTFTNKGIVIADTAIGVNTRGLKTAAPNTTATRQFWAQESDQNSGDPYTTVIGAADLPAETSAQLFARITDPTGSGGSVCFAQGPTIDDAILTGDVDLAAGAIDSIGEIDTPLKTGGVTAVQVVTAAAALDPSAALCTDADGNATTDGCAGGANPAQTIFPESQANLTAGAADAFISMAGNISTVSANAQSVCPAATWENLCCVSTASDPDDMVIAFGKGTYGGAMTFGALTVTLVTQNVVVCDNTNSDTTTLNQGCQLRADKQAATTLGQVRCWVDQTRS